MQGHVRAAVPHGDVGLHWQRASPPCPVCKKPDSALAAGKHAGTCYGCGKVHLEKLYDLVLAPKTAEKAEDAPKTAKREKRNAKAR